MVVVVVMVQVGRGPMGLAAVVAGRRMELRFADTAGGRGRMAELGSS